mmetsp:Transcript_11012/g.23163  ORF Transcript_11012/g.23163 Transcript_11012/m.23163 type:complete len:212 (+) Transcript_11012:57-692(+)
MAWFAFFAVFCCSLASSAAVGSNLNVFGEPLANCGQQPGSGQGDQCTYRSYDAGAHQVCVQKLPHGFSTRTGQGPWSNSHTGHSWCICIWAYANYFLTHGDEDLPVQCSALPAQVLESDYSLAKFKQCGSMSSRCEQFAAAVARMCSTCDGQATTEGGRQELHRKCDGMQTAVGTRAHQYLWRHEADIFEAKSVSQNCSADGSCNASTLNV